LDTKESLAQNVDRLCFARGGALRLEFDELYNALFTNADKYVDIVRLLAERRSGMTSSDIAKETSIDGKRLAKMLSNLERCDFLMKFRYYGKKSNDIIYKLTDFYTLFYIKYIEPNMDFYDEQWWQHHAISHSVDSWQGLTFELLCLMHTRQIRQALNIGGVAAEVSAWFDQADKKKNQRGSQIDLIIERADRITHLCEMKFCQGEFHITTDYEERLRNRMALFREKTKNKMSLVHTFVTTFGVANGTHSSLVHSEVTLDGLFLP
jgi:Mn-dependent DtxR family transcriptional regulator